jgi:nucleotide-binding universal stress UspA family protein
MTLHVLVPLDGSSVSEAVLEHVGRLARECPVAVTLLRVVPPAHDTAWRSETAGRPDVGMAVHPGEPRIHEVETTTQAAARLDAEAIEYLNHAARRLGGAPVAITPMVRAGADPAHELVVAAQTCGADQIAMATHGRTGLRHVVLGSVAEAVVRQSPIPVLLVRPGP